MFVHFWHSARLFVNICKTPGISSPQNLSSKRALAGPYFVIAPAFIFFTYLMSLKSFRAIIFKTIQILEHLKCYCAFIKLISAF